MLKPFVTLVALLAAVVASAQTTPVGVGGVAAGGVAPSAGEWMLGPEFSGGAASRRPQPPGASVALPPIRLAQSTEAVSRPALPESNSRPAGPPGSKPGLLQSLDFKADWAPRTDDDGLGLTTFSAAVGTGIPPFVLGVPVLVTPRVGLTLLDGPAVIDAPASVNDFELSFGTFKKLSERWSVRASISLGVYADDHSLDDSEAFRPSGFGLAIYEQSPQWQWAFGVAYLNRDDVSVIPAAGLIHDRGWVRYELMMPRPRIVWRLGQDECGRDQSVYLAGQFGGGAWAVQRDSGATDTLTLSSYALLLGYERAAAPGSGPLSLGGWKTRYEFGYLFGRDLEYNETGEEVSLDDSLVARVGWTY